MKCPKCGEFVTELDEVCPNCKINFDEYENTYGNFENNYEEITERRSNFLFICRMASLFFVTLGIIIFLVVESYYMAIILAVSEIVLWITLKIFEIIIDLLQSIDNRLKDIKRHS